MYLVKSKMSAKMNYSGNGWSESCNKQESCHFQFRSYCTAQVLLKARYIPKLIPLALDGTTLVISKIAAAHHVRHLQTIREVGILLA